MMPISIRNHTTQNTSPLRNKFSNLEKYSLTSNGLNVDLFIDKKW